MHHQAANLRHPERTLLHNAIVEHFENWQELASAGLFDGQGCPKRAEAVLHVKPIVCIRNAATLPTALPEPDATTWHGIQVLRPVVPVKLVIPSDIDNRLVGKRLACPTQAHHAVIDVSGQHDNIGLRVDVTPVVHGR